MSGNRLRIFLASPNDMADQRRLAREVVAVIDRKVAEPLGLRIEAHGWEDELPAFGRPQGLINPAVDDCDMFVGVLGRRWGTDTGLATSGFHEEYQRAVARVQAGDPLPIWMFLLELTDADLTDPGPQLRQVLEFREQLLQQALVRQFTSVEHFARILGQDLTAHVVSQVTRAGDGGPQTPAEPGPPAEADQAAGELQAGTAQVADVLRRAAASVDPAELDDFAIARLQLFAAAAMSASRTGDVLGVHDANVLYQYRDTLELGPNERSLMLRTICVGSPVAPGWALAEADTAANRLGILAIADHRDDVRRGAIELLDVEPVLEAIDRPFLDVIEAITRDDTRVAVLALLRRSQVPEALEALHALATPGATGADDAAIAVFGALLDRGRYDEALAMLADARLSALGVDTRRELASAVPKLDAALLHAALDSGHEALRELAARELGSRGALDRETCLRLLDDGSLEVRLAAFDALCALGGPVDEQLLESRIVDKAKERQPFTLRVTRPARRAWLGTLPVDDLLGRINWIWSQTSDDYAVLALEHFDVFGTQVRRDLAEEFVSFRTESRNRLREQWVTEITDAIDASATTSGPPTQEVRDRIVAETTAQIETRLDKLGTDETFSRTVFATAALDGLASHGTPDDAQLARAWARDSDSRVRVAAVRALAQAGDATDAPMLLDSARATPGPAGVSLAKAALDLDPGLAERLLDARSELAAVGTHRLLDVAADPNVVWRLLNSDASAVRRAAVAHAARYLDDHAIGLLLKDYLAQSRYFYDVVWTLDRLLFAPDWIRARTRRELQS